MNIFNINPFFCFPWIMYVLCYVILFLVLSYIVRQKTISLFCKIRQYGVLFLVEAPGTILITSCYHSGELMAAKINYVTQNKRCPLNLVQLWKQCNDCEESWKQVVFRNNQLTNVNSEQYDKNNIKRLKYNLTCVLRNEFFISSLFFFFPPTLLIQFGRLVV